MSLSQMPVFNKCIMPATIEMLAQMVAKFNQASNGAIRLTFFCAGTCIESEHHI